MCTFYVAGCKKPISARQISLSALRAIENKEICKLMERLKLEGIEVVTDGGFRSYDFLEGWEGIRCRNNADSSLEKKLEVTGRIGLLHHPILEDFVFLLKNTAENVLPKQHIPSPGKMLMRILRETEAGCLKSVYPDLNILLDDWLSLIRSCWKGCMRRVAVMYSLRESNPC